MTPKECIKIVWGRNPPYLCRGKKSKAIDVIDDVYKIMKLGREVLDGLAYKTCTYRDLMAVLIIASISKGYKNIEKKDVDYLDTYLSQGDGYIKICTKSGSTPLPKVGIA